MKRILHILLCCMMLCSISSCVEEFNAQLPESESNLLVVDGNIVSDSICVFSLSRSFSMNEEKRPEDYNQIDAQIAVIGSDGSRYTGTALGDGKYAIEVGTLNPQQSYHLEIDWEGNTYTSAPQQPLVTEDLELSFDQPEDYGPVHIRVTSTPENTDEVAYYIRNYVEDWEIRTEFRCKALYDPNDNNIYEYDYYPYAQGWVHKGSQETLIQSTENYQGKKFDKTKVYSIASNDPRISYLYSTLVTQRKMTKSEYDYYRSKEKFTNEMGGLFTPQPTELPTNITCTDNDRRVIGYVGVNMNVSSKRLFIPTEKVQYEKDYTCTLYDESTLMGILGTDNRRTLHFAGYRIGFYSNPPMGGMIMISWVARECVDCRAFGADPNGKPDFWPEN